VALVKILQDFHLQISLLEGCQTILNGDSSDFARKLHKDQTAGFFLTGLSFSSLFWARLIVALSQPKQRVPYVRDRFKKHRRRRSFCFCAGTSFMRPARAAGTTSPSSPTLRCAVSVWPTAWRAVSAGRLLCECPCMTIAPLIDFFFSESVVRAKLDQGCPVCHKESEGSRTR
jgi:hypothetical protein